MILCNKYIELLGIKIKKQVKNQLPQKGRKNENQQRIIKRKYENVNTRNGKKREHVWIPNDKKTKRKIK